MISPEQIAKAGTEHAIQAALFCWAAQQKDNRLKMLFAIPNGGERHKVVASKLKAEGVKKGVPDVFLSVGNMFHHGFFIEFKKPKFTNYQNGGCSNDQVRWIDKLTEQGYLCHIHYDWVTAAEALNKYLANQI